MSIYEQLCVTKLFYAAMGMMERQTITLDEFDIACEALKHLADQRRDWTEQQKYFYKWLVDYAKESIEKR